MFILTITEVPTPKPLRDLGHGEETSLPIGLELERLKMTFDQAPNIPAIINLLHKKPRATRKDAGIPRKQ